MASEMACSRSVRCRPGPGEGKGENPPGPGQDQTTATSNRGSDVTGVATQYRSTVFRSGGT